MIRKWLFALTKVRIASNLFYGHLLEVNTTPQQFLIYPHKKTLF